jgi:hypothetical protein
MSARKIKFSDFPPDLDPKDNIYRDAIIHAAGRINFEIDVHFYGCYPNEKFIKKLKVYIFSKLSNTGMISWLNSQQGIRIPSKKDEFNIWVTFENRRPPHSHYDLTLSFDCDTFNDHNFYFPLIYQYMNIRAINSTYAKHQISPKAAMLQRSISKVQLLQKTNFLVSFINNPHPIRLKALDALSKIDKVVTYGRSVNNYADDKLSTSEEFWFSLCFENDLYPGYVTEKVLEAWLGWTIPLYWGNDASGILNSKAIINLANFLTMKDFVCHVSKLYGDKDQMISMINQPLFVKEFKFEDLVNFIHQGLIKKFALQ